MEISLLLISETPFAPRSRAKDIDLCPKGPGSHRHCEHPKTALTLLCMARAQQLRGPECLFRVTSQQELTRCHLSAATQPGCTASSSTSRHNALPHTNRLYMLPLHIIQHGRGMTPCKNRAPQLLQMWPPTTTQPRAQKQHQRCKNLFIRKPAQKILGTHLCFPHHRPTCLLIEIKPRWADLLLLTESFGVEKTFEVK